VLRARGQAIVDEDGKTVQLCGLGLGGWMNMESFITGFSGNEQAWRAALRRELGDERFRFFIDRFLTYFFEEADAALISSLGQTCLRLPINYRHFEDDASPFIVREDGFAHLDRVIELCAAHGIYTVIDLHAMQGYQNQDWHSDNPGILAELWTQRQFQDRAANLWQAIAGHYRGNRWVAGYNLVNEPSAPDKQAFLAVTRRLWEAVQEIDPDHIVFLDGDGYASNLDHFDEAWPNTVYSFHDYAYCGFSFGGEYPGYTRGVWCDEAWAERHFMRKSAFGREHNVPVWVGEFGAVFSGDPARDENRCSIIADQIGIYDRHATGWSLWTYKDVGKMGLVCPSPDSPYMRLLKPHLDKKERLGADSWTSTGGELAEATGPILDLVAREFPDREQLDFDPGWMVERTVQGILLSKALLPEIAAAFRGLTEEDLDQLLQSFRLGNCVVREPLARVLMRNPVPA
jgi:aryl-phospho-beta-D-glucosidase BglC (GH1 family)